MDGNSSVLSVIYNGCSCVLALLVGVALMKLLRNYTRKKGYIEIQQDDRAMYSSALMGTSDSWENVCIVDPSKNRS
ncbi:hypothetical protein Plhal304r1_c002g0006251 [Plasmopara halstedii]